jgi:anti-sigma28 factor (negative regulator of flagellin synthesis)
VSRIGPGAWKEVTTHKSHRQNQKEDKKNRERQASLEKEIREKEQELKKAKEKSGVDILEDQIRLLKDQLPERHKVVNVKWEDEETGIKFDKYGHIIS